VSVHRLPDNSNQTRFSSPEVVEFYSKHEELEPAERTLFDNYLKPDMRVLDVGVGGGRTTKYLSSIVRHYIGIDYSRRMIDACRNRFPESTFFVADASDLSLFGNGSFDAVIFSFNGIDFLESELQRHRFLEHCVRILSDKGFLIFSSHNAHYLCRVPGNKRGFLYASWRWFRSLLNNKWHLWRLLRTGVLIWGEGYVFEPVDGGLLTHYATPERIRAELARFGFQVVELLPYGFPSAGARFNTPWYHYVCIKQ
jgi:SAM-dependent methyltransferase